MLVGLPQEAASPRGSQQEQSQGCREGDQARPGADAARAPYPATLDVWVLSGCESTHPPLASASLGLFID